MARCDLDLLTLNFYSTAGVMCLNFVQNLSEIKKSTAVSELGYLAAFSNEDGQS